MKPRSPKSGEYFGWRFARRFALSLLPLLLLPLPLGGQSKGAKTTNSATERAQRRRSQPRKVDHIPPIDLFGGSFRLESEEIFDSEHVNGRFVYTHTKPQRRIRWIRIWDGNQNPATDTPRRAYSPPPNGACTVTISYTATNDIVIRGGALMMESADFFGQSSVEDEYHYKHKEGSKKVTRVQIRDGNMNPNPNNVQVDYTPPNNGECIIKICYGCHPE